MTQTKLITLEQLIANDACCSQVQLFKDLFGDSVVLTKELVEEHHMVFNVGWVVARLLTTRAWAEYQHDIALETAKYVRVVDTAHAEYNRVVATARTEYNRAVDTARIEYKRVVHIAHAEYNRVVHAALAELMLAKALAFFNLYDSTKENRHAAL